MYAKATGQEWCTWAFHGSAIGEVQDLHWVHTANLGKCTHMNPGQCGLGWQYHGGGDSVMEILV